MKISVKSVERKRTSEISKYFRLFIQDKTTRMNIEIDLITSSHSRSWRSHLWSAIHSGQQAEGCQHCSPNPRGLGQKQKVLVRDRKPIYESFQCSNHILLRKINNKSNRLENYKVCFSVHGKSLQLCPTLCGPMDCSPPGSSIQGILQARLLKRVAMPSSKGSS